jgi:hypothetical protein
MRRICVIFALLCLPAAPALADDWGKEMFDKTEYNFGTIARGAKAEYRFNFQNIYNEDVYVLSAVSTCGCTSPKATQSTLKKWEKAQIVATVDTRSFYGPKEAAVKVRLGFAGSPTTTEVILKVSCLIRGDVVVQPGAVEFGSVYQGTSDAERRVTISYAGRSDWRILRIETNNPNFEIRAGESGRSGGQVSYELWLRLKENTPVGYIKDQLVLVTNDLNTRTSRVPVPIEAIIVPGVTVRPSLLVLGVVTSGQSVTKHLVVQGRNPFRIVRVDSADGRFQCHVPEAANTLHLVPVTFTASGTPGNVSQTLRIQTDGASGTPLEVVVQARIVMPDMVPVTPASGPGSGAAPPAGEPAASANPPPAGPGRPAAGRQF